LPEHDGKAQRGTPQQPKDDKPKWRIRCTGYGKCWLEVNALVPLETALDIFCRLPNRPRERDDAANLTAAA